MLQSQLLYYDLNILLNIRQNKGTNVLNSCSVRLVCLLLGLH